MPRPHTIHPDGVAQFRSHLPDVRIGDVWEIECKKPHQKQKDVSSFVSMTIQSFFNCPSCPAPMCVYTDQDGVERRTSIGALMLPGARRITTGEGASWKNE